MIIWKEKVNGMANPIITITMENKDVIKAELYPDAAPNTVNNFISLVKKNFYDGLIFHRERVWEGQGTALRVSFHRMA